MTHSARPSIRHSPLLTLPCLALLAAISAPARAIAFAAVDGFLDRVESAGR